MHLHGHGKAFLLFRLKLRWVSQGEDSLYTCWYRLLMRTASTNGAITIPKVTDVDMVFSRARRLQHVNDLL